MNKKRQMTVSDRLKDAIRGCGKSAAKLAEETGVPQPTITRFLAGADLRISNADKLAAALGLELTKRHS